MMCLLNKNIFACVYIKLYFKLKYLTRINYMRKFMILCKQISLIKCKK